MTTRLALAELIGRSAALDNLRTQMRRLAQSSERGRLPSVLLLGETGTGKGLVAGLLHRTGGRAAGPFIDINCAAIPETLLEAELFGFERGAFTDARVAKRGLIEAAHQGTLFLDEIGELPDALQVKLLTAIESRQVRRLGSTRSEAVDVWIIAATSLDLSAAMRAGRFRRELYHRLSTVVLTLPPLRAREGDVIELAEHFLARSALEHGVPAKRLDEGAYAALRAYPWPGNIRELGNVLERVTLLEDSPVITAAMLALDGRAGGGESGTTLVTPRSAEALRAEERQQLVEALDRSRGNITRAAAHLRIHRNTLRYRLAKHELTPRAPASDGEAVQPVTSGVVTSSPAAPTAKVIRWEERLVAVLGVSIVAAVGATFDLAAMIADLIQLATSFGARIEQFSPSGLVAVFGIDPMEDAARRAVLVAQAMLQALLRSDDKRHGRFAVHVGSYLIARAGIVTGLDAHAHRQAADAVSGLLGQTRPDEILVDPAAARLLERHFALEAAADGRAGLARVAGRQRRGFEVGGRTLSPFVGRTGDLDSIQALMTRAENGEAQILGLVGEPGVGKSRLLFELIHSRRVEGWLILETRSSSYGAATRDLPVVDLARSYFRISDRDTARDIREKVTGRLLTLDRALEPTLPALFALLELTVDDPSWQALDPSQRRRRTLDAVKRLLEREARIRPLLIVFEDLHWVDPETQAFLDTLVDSVASARLLLVASYRPEYRHTWADKPNYTQLRLDPLPPESADALLGAVLGRDASLDPLKQLLVARTGRNPLFIEESVQTLVETRGVAGDRGAYRLTQSVDAIQVPATVQAILASRIDRLPAEDKRLLEMAAVIGSAVPLPLLQAIAEGDGALAGRLGRLQASEFLYETSAAPDVEYAFKHALTHEVAYGSVLGERRRELHARISAAIERLHGDRLTEHLERLAHHTARGEVWDKALTYSQQAAEKAMARSAYREAVGHFEQAFNALRHQSPERDTRELAIDLRLGLRSALVPFGEHARILATLHEAEELAEALNDHRRLGQVCVSLSYHCCANGAYDDAKAAARRALALATRDGEGALQALANQYVGLAHQAQGDFRRAIECFAQTAAFFDGSRRYERFGRVILPAVSVRADLAACHAELGTFAKGRAIAGDAVEIAEAVGHHTSLMMAYRALGLLLLRQGDVGALSLLERAVTICEDAELPVYFPWMAATLGAAYTLAGRADDAVPLLTRAMQQTTTTERDALSRLGLAEAQLLAGRLEEAAPLAERTLALATEHDERANQGYALRLLAEIASQRQPPEWEEAQARYRQALALSSDIGMRPLTAHCHLGLSRVYRRLDRSGDAEMHRTTAVTMYREMDMRLWLERSEER